MINLFDKKELQKGINYLSINHPIITKLKNKYGEPNFDRGTTGIFHSLIRSIISQQISTKAASSVHTKFKALFRKNKFNFEDILIIKDSKLKSAGLSHQKIKYIKATAEYFKSTHHTNKDFEQMSNKQIEKELIQIKGIGPWTIDMILIFTLGRADIFPIGDLGVRNGFKILFNKNSTEKQMIKKSNQWKPYRTIMSWYLWRVVDGSWETMD
tara:strand:- start:11296 stop:11931 length:636 start_codon:yes stop_codon:yes gene_type:complete